MSTDIEHMAQVAQNKRILSVLAEHEKHGEFSSEYVTLAFSTAEQLIEALLFIVKPKIRGQVGAIITVEHSLNHEFRHQIVKMCFESIHLAYTTLYGYSRRAHYRKYVPVSPNDKNPKELLKLIERKCEEFESKRKRSRK